MTREEALKAWKQMYYDIDKDNWLFVGTINPQMVEWAIRALDEYDRKTENSSEIPNSCEECEHWSDPEDGCADRHGCKDEPQTDCPWK